MTPERRRIQANAVHQFAGVLSSIAGRTALAGMALVVAATLLFAGCTGADSADDRPAPTLAAVSTATEVVAAPTALPARDGKIPHTVVRGETLADIALQYNVTLEVLLEENYGITDPPTSVIEYFERMHADEGCMFGTGYTMWIPVSAEQ
ncbi:MAG: LysM peptidoglycan-binding domain-containing protein [Dehalococcoidia bacterium]|nr:LysM peptidoglycan-binding domain-containing protein [Dehalococcoidia bacterium]MCA9855579.1 LysM peptidoglycan-binding domain-containing protein [Dehalococcoidia bacterium]